MPANLNALIRYKTINSALYGGNRRWSILELTEKCSSALAEYRGRYKTVSERTIRDDIRVMRSDILGYNAPISQQKGLYYYADPEYSIMTIRFTDSALVERIILFLREIKPEVAHPELEIILEKLNALRINSFDRPEKAKGSRRKIVSARDEVCEMAFEPSMPWKPDLLTWSDLFLLIEQ
jgi:predicted DNA-binding transcriptional regulator YafY